MIYEAIHGVSVLGFRCSFVTNNNIVNFTNVILSINSWAQQYANMTVLNIWEWDLIWLLNIFQNDFFFQGHWKKTLLTSPNSKRNQ